MSRAPALDMQDVVPPALRRKWERMWRAAKEQVAKLEVLLNASGGLPPPDGGEPAKPPKEPPKPAVRPQAKRRRRAPKKVARTVKRNAPKRQAAAETAPSHPAPPRGPLKTEAAPVRESARSRHKDGTWTACIRDIVAPTERPWSYSELKDALASSTIADKLTHSDKGFHNAITKLADEGLIVRYKGHVFSPSGYRKFQEDLAAGRIRDLYFPNPAHQSPMGDAITELMKTRPNGAESGNIMWHLSQNPDFASQIEKTPTHVYNVLKRLVTKEILYKKGKRYYYRALEDEAPPNESGSAPQDSGESGVSPDGRRETVLGGLFG